MDDRRWGVGIRALGAGGRPDPAAGARAVPVRQTTSFVDMTFVTAGRSEAFAAAMRAAAKAFSHVGPMRGFVFGVPARNPSQVA